MRLFFKRICRARVTAASLTSIYDFEASGAETEENKRILYETIPDVKRRSERRPDVKRRGEKHPDVKIRSERRPNEKKTR